jgi:outer membrane lipoprotein-sorting protein
MRFKSIVFFAAILFVAAVPGSAATPPEQKTLQSILQQLNVAAANFHSTSADFEFDTHETDPVPDTDVQAGTVYYQRTGTSFQTAAHFKQDNGRPAPKVYTYAKGVFSLFEVGIDQVTTFSKAGKFESYLMLGFGASGKDLADKFDIKYLGSETLMDGKTAVKTEKLEMVAKDPEVRKNIPKVTIWVDPERAISLKQVFDQGAGTYRVNVYFNIKTNVALSPDLFILKTDKQTTFVNK